MVEFASQSSELPAKLPSVSDIFDLLPFGLALIDENAKIQRLNPAFFVSFGLIGDALGQDIAAMLVDEDQMQFRSDVRLVYALNQPTAELRVRLAARPEEPVVITLAATPPSAITAQRGVMMAVRDIREQLRIEAKVAQVTKMQAVAQLAGGVAHDFNNVLTAILGLCDQLLTRHFAGDEDFEDIDEIRRNANRAAALVRQLLAFARQQTLKMQSVDVENILGPLAALLRRLVGPLVELNLFYGHGNWLSRVDPGQIEQVIVNLAVNARDAMPGGGKLNITTRAVLAREVAKLGHPVMPAANFVEISVVDSGAGIVPEIAAKIFEPFFTTKPVGQGTGLGLSSVYGIVKQCGGFIFMSQPVSGGTQFDIYLPAPRVKTVAATPIKVPAKIAEKLSGRVLLVEDERAVRLVVERALRIIGLDVVSAADGETALLILANSGETIDLLISDVVMPGMDGIALTTVVRKQLPNLPMILMSGYAEPPQRRAVGGHDTSFLSKPFAATELEAVVREMLGKIIS